MYEYKVNIERFKDKDAYDGDTVKLFVDLGFHLESKITLRLANINTPEVNRKDEKEAGIKSRDWLRSKLNDARDNKLPVHIKTYKDKTGKYGRLIADLFVGDMNLNLEMVKLGLAEEKNY